MHAEPNAELEVSRPRDVAKRALHLECGFGGCRRLREGRHVLVSDRIRLDPAGRRDDLSEQAAEKSDRLRVALRRTLLPGR